MARCITIKGGISLPAPGHSNCDYPPLVTMWRVIRTRVGLRFEFTHRQTLRRLQESSAPRADEHAIWDTLRSRKPGSLRAMPSRFETSCAV